MFTRPTLAQIEAYRNDGYVVLEGFLSDEELEKFRSAVMDGIAVLGTQLIAGNPELREPQGYDEQCVFQRVNLWKVNSTVKEYFLNHELGRMLCEFAVLDGIRIWHDQTFFKPPGGKPTAFHLDMPNWSFFSAHAIAVWIALDEATVENGCLCYLPGSHKVAIFDRNASLRDEADRLFHLCPELNRDAVRYAKVSAGSAIVHNAMVVHGAGPNQTPYWRRAMTCQYMPIGARFNGKRSVLTSQQLSQLSPGDPLSNNDEFPLVWHNPRIGAAECPGASSTTANVERNGSAEAAR
jgi:phytanoyl-CoA hydroxylase